MIVREWGDAVDMAISAQKIDGVKRAVIGHRLRVANGYFFGWSIIPANGVTHGRIRSDLMRDRRLRRGKA